MKLEKRNNSFFINKKKQFTGQSIKKKDLERAFEFAFEMAIGKGHHRTNRSGGNETRTSISIFRNTLQGKLAEIILYNFFMEKDFICNKIDFSISGKGVWDNCDLIINDKNISIKSAAYFSNLLLLETADWDSNGNYIPNFNNNNSPKYDYFILVRIKPNTNSLFKNSSKKEILKKEMYSQNWFFDFAGCCSLETLIYVINNEYILPKNSLLNGKIKMDAENYYIQSGDLKDLNLLIKELSIEK